MPASLCVHRRLSLVVLSCLHRGDKCQRQQLTVCESPCGVKLLPYAVQEAGREEGASQGQEPSFRGTLTLLGRISSSPLTAWSAVAMFTSPSEEARAWKAHQPEAHSQYRSLGDTSGSLELVLQMAVGCPVWALGAELSPLKNSECSSSPGRLSAALGFPSVDCAVE